MRDPELYRRILDFEMDAPGVEFPFSEKLRKVEKLSADKAAKAILEYKRFLYLATISAQKVTPSRIVDRVWHLHLTYTHDYWDRLCAGVLGGALHHEPATGPAEAERFAEQYRHTYRLYTQEFGAPPRAMWSKPPKEGRPIRATGGAGRHLRFGLIWAAVFFGLHWLFAPQGMGVIPVLLGSGFVALMLSSALGAAAGSQSAGFSYGVHFGGGDGDGGDGDGGGCGD